MSKDIDATQIEYADITTLVSMGVQTGMISPNERKDVEVYIEQIYKADFYRIPTDVRIDENCYIRIPLTLKALQGLLKQREYEIENVRRKLCTTSVKPSEEPTRTEIQAFQIRQFTDEQIDLLRGYFVTKFKGMGNNYNYFDDNLLIDLKKNRSGIEYAKIAKLIYESPNAKKEFKNKPFSQWYETFCSIMGVKKCKYKISQIYLDEGIKKEFYYLT